MLLIIHYAMIQFYYPIHNYLDLLESISFFYSDIARTSLLASKLPISMDLFFSVNSRIRLSSVLINLAAIKCLTEN